MAKHARRAEFCGCKVRHELPAAPEVRGLVTREWPVDVVVPVEVQGSATAGVLDGISLPITGVGSQRKRSQKESRRCLAPTGLSLFGGAGGFCGWSPHHQEISSDICLLARKQIVCHEAGGCQDEGPTMWADGGSRRAPEAVAEQVSGAPISRSQRPSSTCYRSVGVGWQVPFSWLSRRLRRLALTLVEAGMRTITHHWRRREYICPERGANYCRTPRRRGRCGRVNFDECSVLNPLR